MSLFKKLGFEKGDERMVYIGFYSTRIAWVFTSVVLMIWSLQGLLTTDNIPVQFIVFSSTQVVYWLSYLHYRKKLGS
ncbi:hypothetical protein [Candidatus Formimonas warabiya]|uniref:Uncharacterized protein n=1 Tax=Formimonas warabiya TaxID=1761012 RepID=A0A3G1KVN6_FORW1|nr:hypothetical protein [Candidatus Formimonas warabiya]ATW26593.1 hypothetical protein DCMF_19195 [Candidatus Formimonas warabiya]